MTQWGEWQSEPLFHGSLRLEENRDLLDAAGFKAIDFIEADPVGTLWLATRKEKA